MTMSRFLRIFQIVVWVVFLVICWIMHPVLLIDEVPIRGKVFFVASFIALFAYFCFATWKLGRCRKRIRNQESNTKPAMTG